MVSKIYKKARITLPHVKNLHKKKSVTIEFIISPNYDNESAPVEIFETVIIPIGVYTSIYNQLLREDKLRAIFGKEERKVTATDFYTALKERHEQYDKAIGYHTAF